MRNIGIYIVSCLLAGFSPLITPDSVSKSDLSQFPGWQTSFEGKPLKKLPLSEIEKNFSEDFPGFVSRFSDNNRQIIFRWVKEETRKLHPASDCFKGMGYSIKPLPVFVDNEKKYWGRFQAIKNDEKIVVSERIFDDKGNSWTDVSSWYWAAFLSRGSEKISLLKSISPSSTQGPWWTITIAEKIK